MKNRRQFLKTSLLGLGLFGLAELLGTSLAHAAKKIAEIPAGMKEVPDSDPVVKAIGYKSDIKNIDYKKYPQRKKPDARNQFCDNCALYTSANEGWGKCSMLAAGLVASKGWCGSWSKGTKV